MTGVPLQVQAALLSVTLGAILVSPSFSAPRGLFWETQTWSKLRSSP